MTESEQRQAGAISQFTEVSLDKAARLLCAYDPENDHPRDVVLAILEATVGSSKRGRGIAARIGRLR